MKQFITKSYSTFMKEEFIKKYYFESMKITFNNLKKKEESEEMNGNHP